MADESNSQTGTEQNGEGQGEQRPTPDVATIANAAASSQLKRFMEKQLPTILEAATRPLLDQIAALRATPPKDEDSPSPKGKMNPEVAALSAQLEEFKKKLAEENQLRSAAEKKAREDRAFAEMKGHLVRFVRPEMLDVLAEHLFKSNVTFGEDGSATFKGTRKAQYGLDEEVDYPLKDGVEAWSKLESSKAWIPPPSPGTQTAPTARRQVVAPGQLSPNTDFSKMSPQQKADAAKMLEANIASILNENR